MKPPDFSLILPCYNEGQIFNKNVEWILDTLKRSRFSFEIIFVDDKSQDKTKQLIQKVCATKPKFCRAIYHSQNLGRGTAVKDGIISAKGKVAGYIDIDCEVSPVYIPEAVDKILKKQADVVVGRRIYKLTPSSILRAIMTVGYKKLSSFILPTDNIDTESGYKFFNRKKILPILKLTNHPHWFWDTQIIVFSKLGGLKITEIPVLFLKNPNKKSTIRILKDVPDYLVNLWRFYWKLKKLSPLPSTLQSRQKRF